MPGIVLAVRLSIAIGSDHSRPWRNNPNSPSRLYSGEKIRNKYRIQFSTRTLSKVKENFQKKK
jgi:hypothetical protein